MNPVDALNAFIQTSVPFAAETGLTVTELGRASASLTMPDRPTNQNHIKTIHAGALYTLGETAAGATLSTCFDIMTVPFVAVQGSIQYIAKARGTITARGTIRPEVIEAANENLKTIFKADVPVEVVFTDDEGTKLATMTLDFRVYKKKPKA